MLIPLFKAMIFLLPGSIGLRLAVFLASLAPRVSVKPEDQKILDNAERFSFGTDAPCVAWRWGAGPLVVLVHGWGGRGAQMVKIADAIARSGHEVVVFDGKGHGESPGRRIGFRRLIEDLEALDRTLDRPVAGWVCHSAGGLCLAAAAIKAGQRDDRLIFLAVPRAPYIPVNELNFHLKLRPSLIDRCRRFYAREFDMSWQALDQCRAFAAIADAQLLLVQDRHDPRVEDRDAERIAEVCTQAEILRTQGMGHLKLLWSDAVVEKVVSFLSTSTANGNKEKVNRGD